MKMRVTKMLVASATFATLIASEQAYAAPKYSAPALRETAGPNDVQAGGRAIGQDPDPFIRGEMLRHWHSGAPD
jgi:hypothetical protein